MAKKITSKKSKEQPTPKKLRTPIGVLVHGEETDPFFKFYAGTRSDSSYEGWDCFFDENHILSQTLDKGVLLTAAQLDAMPKGRLHIGTTNHKHGMPECIGTSNDDCLIVNERVRDLILRAAPKDFHVLPIRMWIDNRPGVTVEGMWFMQPIHFIDCIDKERSTWEPDANHPWGGVYTEEVYDASRLPKDVMVFRIVRGPRTMFCRRPFMEAMAADNFRYMTFYGRYSDKFVDVSAS